jgi:hypothetical protein
VDFVQTGRLRALVSGIRAELIHDGAMYAVRVSGPSAVAIDFTTDRTLFAAAIKNLMGHGLRADDEAQIVGTDAPPNEVSRRRQSALDQLRAAFHEHTRRHGPPNTLVFVSSGYFRSTEYRHEWAATLRPLVTSDVNVYVLNPAEVDDPQDSRLERGRVVLLPQPRSRH